MDKRIVLARSCMNAAQSAAKDESKISAGDKHELSNLYSGVIKG
ncbi:MAG: hypothetical protein ACK4ND_11965 [Cytophagaceae bacterium]